MVGVPGMIDELTTRIIAIVTRVIRHRPGVPEVTPESTFKELHVDEIDRWGIDYGIQEEFDIELDEDETRAWMSIADVVASVERWRVCA
jgi:acyl carrier protein